MFGDDDDFAPGASSNLAALFSKARIESGNPTLTYTPPKQPRTTGSPKSKVSAPTSSSNTLDLLFVKTVQSFKLEGSNFHAQGKAGAAILGNANTKYYQILIYKDKHNHLCSARINKDFKFMIQARNYATFYDKNKCVWSVLFDSEEDLVAFGIEIALMRWNSEESPTLTVQDLWVPEVTKEETADYGHYVQFTYTAYTVELNKLGREQGDGAIKTAQVSKTGWEQGLFRAIKDMQRFIIVPPSQLGIWKSLVDADTPVAVKLTFTVVQTTKSEEIQAAISDSHNLESSAEGNVKARGASIKEALTSSPQAAKANLISRMAKMGQATLPFKGAVPTPSDSDEPEEDQNVKVDGEVRTVPPPRPRVRTTNQVVTHTTSSVVTQPPASWFPQHPYMVGGMYPQIQSPVSDPQLPVFFSEVRTHNSELRMGITRVTDKIDTLMTKLDHLPKSNVECAVLENVNRISEDNLMLRKEVESKLSTVQAQNEQLLKLLSETTPALRQNGKSEVRNRKKFEEVDRGTSENESCTNHKEVIAQLEHNNLELTQKYEDAVKRLKFLEEQLENTEQISESHVKNLKERGVEVEKFKSIVEAQSARIESLEREMNESVDQKTVINSLKERLIKYDEEVETLSIQLAQRDKLIDTLDKSVKEKHDVIQHLSATLDMRTLERQQLEEQLNELQSQNVSKLAVADEIKYVMNYVYRTLKGQFMSQESYSYSDIHSILAETIKNATVQYLQQSIIGVGPSGVHYTPPVRENLHVASSLPVAPDIRSQSPKTEYTKDPVVGPVQPVNLAQSPKIEYIKEPVVNTESEETQSQLSVSHIVFGEYKNLQQRQEMEKGQLKKLSSQQSVTVKPAVSEKQISDISLTVSDKAVSSEGDSLADKESCEATDVIKKAFEANSKETSKTTQEEGSKESTGVIEITLPRMETNDDSADDMWRPQPPPPPLFDEDENEDDWLNT